MDVRRQYNQVVNFVYTEQATNIKVGKLAPKDYMNKVITEIKDNTFNISTIDSNDILEMNLEDNDIPQYIMEADTSNYNSFLEDRRKLMAQKIKAFYLEL